MSVNRERHEDTCLRCHRRPQEFGLFCELCLEDMRQEALCEQGAEGTTPSLRGNGKRAQTIRIYAPLSVEDVQRMHADGWQLVQSGPALEWHQFHRVRLVVQARQEVRNGA